MTAQEALKAALRDTLGPVVRSHGFKGSSPTWRRSTPAGDWAVVNVQSSSFSSGDRLPCVVNLAVAPEPWLRWLRQNLGPGMPKSVHESLGLYRDRLHPTGSPERRDVWWEVTDATSARASVEDMGVQLNAGGWPLLDRLLQPNGMLDTVRAGDLGHMKREYRGGVFFAQGEAVLLMDRGPSPDLDELLEYAIEESIPTQKENMTKFATWVRSQANNAN